MKFIVKKGPFNEVDVKLHYQTKDKIREVLTWVGIAMIGISVTNYIDKKDNKTAK